MTAARMSRRSRRRGTAAAAAMPAPDAELLRLEAQLAETNAAHTLAYAALCEAEGRLPDWAVWTLPRWEARSELRLIGVAKDIEGLVTLAAIREFNRRTESIVADWRDLDHDDPARERMRATWTKRRQEGRERVKWWRAEVEIIAAERARHGLPQLAAECDRLEARVDEIETAILATPAGGVAGIAVKLRMISRRALSEIPDGGKPEDYLGWADLTALSALADAERQAEKGGAA